MIRGNHLHCDFCGEIIRFAPRKEVEEHEEDPTLELEMQPDLCKKCESLNDPEPHEK